jgi:hypothetical protein
MRYSFFVPNQISQDVKSLVREYPSLRFDSNPLELGSTTSFSISGEVEDMNLFSLRLEELQERTESAKEVEKRNFFQRFISLF